jgi:scyllo-inositol 2-dehydrogenase (NADP+)
VSEATPIRVASIGLGWVTTNRHLPALRRCAQAQLLGVIDRQPGRAERIARETKLPLSATARSADEVSWLDQVDAVTIGTPPLTHYSLVRGYLEAGKHVLVEKPMAMTVAEAEELTTLAAERGRVLAVVHNFQFMGAVRRLKRMMADGGLGEIRSIWAVQMSNPKRRLPTWYEELPLGLFYDESPHFFYLLRTLADREPEFRSIYVLRSRDGAETPAKITAQLDAGGIPIQVDMNFQAPLSEWHIGVLAAKRAAFVDVFRDILVTVPNDRTHLGRDILRTSAIAGWSHLVGTVRSGTRSVAGRLTYGNDEVVERFCRACQGEANAVAGISASDGTAVVKMQHHVVEAARQVR